MATTKLPEWSLAYHVVFHFAIVLCLVLSLIIIYYDYTFALPCLVDYVIALL